MELPIVSGIQQIGIGVQNVHEAYHWYRKTFGQNIRIFEEAAEANLMLPYTGGMPQKRHAILSLHPRGGGGYEIWQYTSRKPQPPAFSIRPGDLGILANCIKTDQPEATHKYLSNQNLPFLGKLHSSGEGLFFWGKDPFNNFFKIVQSDVFFQKGKSLFGGPCGAVLGVSAMEKSIAFYRNILGYDKIVFDQTGVFEDLGELGRTGESFRRVILTHSRERKGPFAPFFGNSKIELLQLINGNTEKIFKDRLWGDLGYIHLCFDIRGLDELSALCKKEGHPFTVESPARFDMGEAAGRFSYVEDPDGTLIEFVETHKIPLLKKIGWYLNLKNRAPEKALPNWILKAMTWNQEKD
jgi:catechol 2,3-dioxygenase-like lactoylglutathione lyase family enzyme